MQWSNDKDASPILRHDDALRQPFEVMGPRFCDDAADFVMPLGLNLPARHPLPLPLPLPKTAPDPDPAEEACEDGEDESPLSDADSLRAELVQLTEAWLEEMGRSVECLLLLKWTHRLLSRSFKVGLVTERDAKEMRRLLRSINFVTKV